MATKTDELVLECRRLSENCLYTSTSFFYYLRALRWIRLLFIGAPLILGSLATWNLLTASKLESVKIVTAIFAFLAGLLPSLFSALKFDEHLADSKLLAGEFKNLQDRFRQCALVSSKKTFAEFESEFKENMARLERARTPSATLPEMFFKMAQRKIKSRDYDFDVDLEEAAKVGSEAGRPTEGDKA